MQRSCITQCWYKKNWLMYSIYMLPQFTSIHSYAYTHISYHNLGADSIKKYTYQYRKSHCGDKTILRPSYLHNGITYTDKMTSLYWIRALGADSILRHHLTRVGNPMVEIRRYYSPLISKMIFLLLVRQPLYIGSARCFIPPVYMRTLLPEAGISGWDK